MWHGLTMKPEAKKQWVNNLRSGKFKQGQNRLKIMVESGKSKKLLYCCLGVFAVQQNVKNKENECQQQDFNGKKTIEFLFQFTRKRNEDEEAVLPEFWFGKFFTFRSTDSGYNDKEAVIDKLEGELTSMNDGGTSFKKIANWIEKNL